MFVQTSLNKVYSHEGTSGVRNSFLESPQVFSGDDESLDLSCALVDLQKEIKLELSDTALTCSLKVPLFNVYLVDLGVPHQLFYRIFAVEAVASKYLNGVGGHLIGDVSGEGLSDRGVVRVSATLVHFPGGPLVRHPCQFHLHRHLSQKEGHSLVL